MNIDFYLTGFKKIVTRACAAMLSSTYESFTIAAIIQNSVYTKIINVHVKILNMLT